MAKKRLLEGSNAESQRDGTASPRKKDNSSDIMRPVSPLETLPPEIRNMIWELVFYPALESRIYIPGALIKGVEPYPDYQHGMPQSSRVCKEAHDFALHKRKLVPIWQDEGQKPIHALVDSKRDALYYDSNWDIGGGFEEIKHVFETIIINPSILSVILLRKWSTTFALSPRLKKIQVVCQTYDWEIPRRSVGTVNNFLIFDLDDKIDMKRLLELRSLHPDSKISNHVDPCSEMSDTSVSETSDHSDTKISWEVVDEDIRCLQTGSFLLHLTNGTSERLEPSGECPYLWLKDCRGSGGSDQYVYLPEGATVELQENAFYEKYVIELSWLALNTILGQIWSKDLNNKPTFQRVIQFYLG